MSANAMDEVIPSLWIGDLASALNTDQLREHNIRSVLSAMRGRVRIHEVRRCWVCLASSAIVLSVDVQ